MRLFVIILVAGQILGSTLQDRVTGLLHQADHETIRGPHWAKLMMEADNEAEQMAERPSKSAGRYRSVLVGDYSLTFVANGIEDYQHDLVKSVIVVEAGTTDGALALDKLLNGPGSCGRVGNEFTPYFKSVLDIVASPEWESGAEATSNGTYPEDDKPGGQNALKQAILGYRESIRRDVGAGAAHDHLKKLKAGQDTWQRNWICFGE